MVSPLGQDLVFTHLPWEVLSQNCLLVPGRQGRRVSLVVPLMVSGPRPLHKVLSPLPAGLGGC